MMFSPSRSLPHPGRQRGAVRLLWVGVGSGLLALLGMAAMFSMRTERNLFAEGASKVGAMAATGAGKAVESVRAASGGEGGEGDGVMRKCVINGKTVISNSECAASNPSSKVIPIHDTKGFEAPKIPPKPVEERGSHPLTDKIIEKQLR